jgi:hypothetical protein
MVARACVVAMLVYILTASHVKSFAVGGRRGNCTSCSLRSNEDDMKDGIAREYVFRILSTHRPRPCIKLPLMLTIGLVFQGFLCTFAVM